MTSVERYSKTDPRTGLPYGDYLRVGGEDLGSFCDIVQAEYERAKVDHPENPAVHMRPMFYTGSPYGAEILDIARKARLKGEKAP